MTRAEKVKEARSNLNKAWKLVNQLMGYEPSSHTDNGIHLYRIRQEIEQAKLGTTFLKYPQKKVPKKVT